jgi:hypothetical protein
MRAMGDSNVAARVRCSRMIRNTATWTGVVLVSTAALSGFLTGVSMQMYATYVLAFGIIPAAAVMVIAAILVSLVKLLGLAYDLLLAACAYTFASLTGIDTNIVRFRELRSHRVLVRATDQLIRAMMEGRIWTTQLLQKVTDAIRNGWTLVGREVALEIAWAQLVAARLSVITTFVASWPIRSTAQLLLKFKTFDSVGEPSAAHHAAVRNTAGHGTPLQRT